MTRPIKGVGSYRHRLGVAVVLSLSGLVPLFAWWRSRQLVWGLDGSFPVRLGELNRYFVLGTTAYAAPDARKLSFLIPWALLLRCWAQLGLPWDAAVAQRIFEVGLLLTSAFTCRMFIRKLFPFVSEVASCLGALFYVANLYVMTTIWTSQSYLMVHYSFLPLLALALMSGLESRRVLRWIAVGLAWTLMMSPAYITTPLVVTDLAVFGFLAAWAVLAERIRMRQVLIASSVILFSWIFFNLYWLVPLAKDYTVTFAQGIASLGGSESINVFRLNSAPLLPALRLGGYWGLAGSFDGSLYYPWSSWNGTLVDLIGYLPILFAAAALLVAPRGAASSVRSRWTVALLGMALGILLFCVTGGTGPLGAITVQLFLRLHLLDPFRSVYQRFMEYVPLAVAPLLAVGYDALARVWGKLKRRWRKVAIGPRIATFIAAGLAVVLVPLPFWTGGLFARSGLFPSERVSIPSSYMSLAARIPDNGGSILSLPIGYTNVTYLQWARGANGFMGMQPLSFMTALPVLDQAPAGSYVRRVLRMGLTDGRVCSSLEELNVSSVALESDADSGLMAVTGGFLGIPLSQTSTILRNAPCLRLVGSRSGLVLYRNAGWTPNLVSFGGALGGPRVRARYTVHPGNVITIRRPAFRYRYLFLNEPNDGGWLLSGARPISGTYITAFRRPSGRNIHLVLVNENTRLMRLLLVMSLTGAAALCAALVCVSLMQRRNRRDKRLARVNPAARGSIPS